MIHSIPGEITKLLRTDLRSVSLTLFLPLLLFLALLSNVSTVNAQSVSHPVSSITTTAKHFSYTYILSPTQKKELEYVIVKASNGEIKTVFNACDVCYAAHKGYSQNGTELRCNNCGNRFPIDGLGIKNTGGSCNPGYLPHTIENGNVVIQVADLIVGAYFFLTQNVTGIRDDLNIPATILFSGDRRSLTVMLPSDAPRTFHVFNMSGQHRFELSHTSRTVQFDLSGYTAGAYVLLIDEAGKFTNARFLVY